ncbi:MAG: hypothetical protein JO324_07525 [Candidatus Eremiobacteraeota bacterium]|nr:hypothetical protein [Candidatus Eremiobacteraeota bacterium]
MPWFFPKNRNKIDLSMLDPAMWPGRYSVTQLGKTAREGYSVVRLQALSDPSLHDALVFQGPAGRTRALEINYTDGAHITMNVQWNRVGQFMVPSNLVATIDEPHLALSASADFKDYRFDE